METRNRTRRLSDPMSPFQAENNNKYTMSYIMKLFEEEEIEDATFQGRGLYLSLEIAFVVFSSIIWP